jgi:hypothetical protein
MTVPAGSPLNPEKAAFDGFFMDVNLEDGHQKLTRRTFAKMLSLSHSPLCIHCGWVRMQMPRAICVVFWTSDYVVAAGAMALRIRWMCGACVAHGSRRCWRRASWMPGSSARCWQSSWVPWLLLAWHLRK